MRLLLDGSFGRSTRDALVSLGHDVELADLMAAAPLSDDEIVAISTESGRALVTLDEHFANPLRFDPSRTAGMIIVSLPDERPAGSSEATEDILDLKAQVTGGLMDLERELVQLEREMRTADNEVALLRESAEVMTDDVTPGAAELDAALGAADARRASLAASRDAVRAARDEAEATLQRLTSRYYDVLVKNVSDMTSKLVEQLDDGLTGADRSVDDELRQDAAPSGYATAAGATARAASAHVDADSRFEHDPAFRAAHAAAFRAAHTEAVLAAKLRPIWGSIARELARALARFLSVAEVRDPTGKLWLVAVGGVLERRPSTHPPA